MNPQTVKINKKGMVILPKGLCQAWKGVEAFLFPDEDTLVIKKVQKPLSRLSGVASRVSSPKLSSKQIQKEIQAFREVRG